MPAGTEFTKDMRLFGDVKRDAIVKSGISVKMTGDIRGDLTLERDSAFHIWGAIKGDVIDKGGELHQLGEIKGIRRPV
jgi:cytoskeletal protein CcmA (bactofilin family)